MVIELIKTYLRLEPLKSEEKILGETKIAVNLTNATNKIVLNSKLIDIQKIEVLSNNNNFFSSYSLKNDTDELILELTSEVQGTMEIVISFISKINKEFYAFYKANVRENGDYILVTHCAYGETRRAFPCFDTPTMKCVFELELIVDTNEQAVFNTAIKSEQPYNEKKKLLVFEPTPKMPPDILFFGIGDLDIIEKTKDDKKFRFIAEKPKASNGSFALDTLVEAYEVSQNYFKFPYPITKLDLFAIDRSYDAAMENWGAISIIEPMALVYTITTNDRKDFMQMAISHEVSHQWFGDLVSPTNFKKYIWLNESFATYFGFKVLKEMYPDKPVWERFLKDQQVEAQLRDSFICTVPIELPGDAIQAIDVLSIPIIYNKGACVIRQLDNFIGFDKFRDGIRSYIEKFAFANATSEDLWNTLEHASNLPIKAFMRSWISQPGHPWITASIKNKKITLKQERFSFIKQNNKQKWFIPLTMKIYLENSESPLNLLMDDFKKELTIDFKFNNKKMFYFINESAFGLYHVFYDRDNLTMIIKNKNKLSPTQKFILASDYFGFFIGGKCSLQTYFDIILSFKDDINYLFVISILRHLRFLKIHLNNEFFNKIINFGQNYLKSIATKIGIEPSNADTKEISEIRSLMLGLLYDYNVADVIDFAIKNYNKIINNEQIDPSLIGNSLIIGAKEIGDITTLIDKYSKESREEMKMRYLSALANCKYKGDKIIFDFCLTKLSERHLEMFIGNLALNTTFNKALFSFLVENRSFFSAKNYNVQERVYYSILGNSKTDLSKITEFILTVKEKSKEYDKVLQLAEEESTIYHRLYELNSLKK